MFAVQIPIILHRSPGLARLARVHHVSVVWVLRTLDTPTLLAHAGAKPRGLLGSRHLGALKRAIA